MNVKKHDQEYIKKLNKTMVLKIIGNKGPISRADIARITDMSPTSISRIVGELDEMGLVEETMPYSNGVGRKATLVDIKPGSAPTIGVYLNRDIIHIGIVDYNGNVIFEKEETFNASKSSIEHTAEKVADEIQALVGESGIDMAQIVGIGIGMPGIIDLNRGRVILSAQLGWHNADFANLIEQRLKKPVIIDNTVKLKALAESLYGAARDSRRSSLISIGSGVGSALVMNGEVLRGEINSAGEVGHTTVDPDGMLCECGRRGCLQTYIAEGALIQEANKVREIKNIEEIFKAAENEEGWAVNMLERAAMYITIAINNIACMYSPDTIILCGRLIEQHPQMIELIEKKRSLIWEPFKETFKLVYSELKGKSVIIGAATLALNTYLILD